MSTIQGIVVRQEGTSLVLKTPPAIGILSLSSFIDDATPDVGPIQFVKTFRYSKNGVTFSDWLPLIIGNVTAISLNAKDVFVAEINYEKVEPSNTNYLDVDTITFTAVDAAPSVPGFYFSNSLFSRYFNSNDPEVLAWYINVLEKLYQRGLIPNFIDRKDPLGSDQDFIDLWASVSRFFSYYVTLARTYARFYENETLLRDFLNQRGINTSPEDTLPQLQEILETYYFQLGQRGTLQIVKENTGIVADGELLRLIHYKKDYDEFVFALHRKQHFGWNLGNSSPLHKGLRINDGLNKLPWSKGYVGFENSFPFLTGTTSVAVDGAGVSQLSLSPGTIGFGVSSKVKVDPRLDYQISFQIKLISGTFSLVAAGYNDAEVGANLLSRKTGGIQNAFLSNAVLSRDDKFVTVRCYLYNKDRGVFANDATNIKQGQNLLTTSLVNSIGLTLSASGQAIIKDFRMVPMQTLHSRGFLQVNNFISTWLENRNGDYKITDLENYISKYLIPYNCHIKVNDLSTYEYSINQDPADTLFWVGGGEYCRRVTWIGTGESCEIETLTWEPEESTAYCEQQ